MSRLVLAALVSAGLTVSCSHSPHSSDRSGGARYYDSAFDDRNRAPASLLPPKDAGQFDRRVDQVSVRAKADYHYAMGEAYSNEGQTPQAIEAFKTTLLYDPHAPEVHLRLSSELIKQGHLTEALDMAMAAEKLNPNKIETLMLLGGIYSTMKEYPKAIGFYERVLKLEPKNTEAPMYLGAVHAEIKQRDKALRYFESLLKNEDYTTPHLAWYYMGRIHGDYEAPAHDRAAVQAYQKALSIKGDHVDSVLSLGLTLTRMGQVKRAIETYRNFQRDQGPHDRITEILAQYYLEQEDYINALEQLKLMEKNSEDSLSVKVRIAMIHIELKQLPAASEKLFEVLRQVPDSDKIRFYLAAVLEEMGDFENAVTHFAKVPSDSTFYGESVIHATFLLKKLSRTDDALKMVESALGEKKSVPQFYSIAATLWDDKGELAKAEQRLIEGLAAFPDHIQLHFILGNIADRRGNKEKVIEQMRKVIGMDPHHVQALNYLAFTFAEMGQNLDEAEQLVKRALVIEPSDGYIMDTYGWILFKQGKAAEAAKVLEKAHALQPNEAVIAEHLGEAYYQLQLFDKAKGMYERALAKTDDKKKAGEIQQKILAMGTQLKLTTPVANPRMPASANQAD